MQQENEVTTVDNGPKIAFVTALTAAYLGQNHTTVENVPAVIAMFSKEFDGLNGTVAAEAPAEAKREPAVPIKKSVHEDFIVDLFSGKNFKSLKRHLKAEYNMTPDEYRQYWGLPSDYPMVAASYSTRRSNMAKAIGLGRGRASVEASTEAAPKAKRAAKAKAPAPATDEGQAEGQTEGSEA